MKNELPSPEIRESEKQAGKAPASPQAPIDPVRAKAREGTIRIFRGGKEITHDPVRGL